MEKGRVQQADMGGAVAKPAGGFVFITGTAILSAWWAYRRQIIGLKDLRVWLACFELVARRCAVRRGRAPRYTAKELIVLVSSNSEGSVRRSIGRLRSCGLLEWSESALRVGQAPRRPSEADPDGYEAFAGQVSNHERRVPVPRRIIRMLAKDGNKVMLATVLGHLFRCLYYRKGTCRPTGTCKASWIAATFEVDVRNVKAARAALVAAGLLRVEHRSQWFLNRFGPLVTVNMNWENGLNSRRETPPPGRAGCRGLPPPNKKPELLRIENQKPPRAAPGIRTSGRPLPRPDLRHVLPADLAQPGRLAILHEQARKAGYVNGSEADRLKFFAAAEHARTIGARNPPGLFVAIVRRQRWSYLTLADEDMARRKLSVNQPRVAANSPNGVRNPPTPVSRVLAGMLDTMRIVATGVSSQQVSNQSLMERVGRVPIGVGIESTHHRPFASPPHQFSGRQDQGCGFRGRDNA